jgi:cold-inducible RNA-binding protein
LGLDLPVVMRYFDLNSRVDEQQDEMATKVFVGGLSWDTNDEGLRTAFAGFGEVVEAKVITDRDTGRSRGFGFVTFADANASQAAIAAMDGKQLDGRNIRVSEAQERRGGPGGGGGGPGRGGPRMGGGPPPGGGFRDGGGPPGRDGGRGGGRGGEREGGRGGGRGGGRDGGRGGGRDRGGRGGRDDW